MVLGQPVLLRLAAGEYLLSPQGSLLEENAATQALCFDQELCRTTQDLLTQGSLYALAEELRRGWLTLPGGHRVGLCGHAVLDAGRIATQRELSSFNIRIARAVPGCAAPLLPYLLPNQSSGGRLRSALLISPPGGGKTTLLRDIAAQLSRLRYRVGIADERGEIAAMQQGLPQLPLGLRCDVLSAAPKAEAMQLLLRSMSPQVLLCDALGTPAVAEAVADAARCGVAVVATAHGGDVAELRRRPVLRELLAAQAFGRLVLLSAAQPGAIAAVYDAAGEAVSLC
ncbi:MAG: stage III sporulation protein AA [Firmicutes bacterium]|nr:stage III sporulation protein AA [Bacillota bacterium]